MVQALILSGRAGAGKDTLAQMLTDTYGYVRVAYADALKDEVSQGYGIARRELDDPALKDAAAPGHAETRRQIMQRHGAMRRAEDPDYWVATTVAKIKRILQNGGRVVVTDARFENELMHGDPRCTTVRITRPGLVRSDTDVSETALDAHKFDVVLHNVEGEPERMFAPLELHISAAHAARAMRVQDAITTIINEFGVI